MTSLAHDRAQGGSSTPLTASFFVLRRPLRATATPLLGVFGPVTGPDQLRRLLASDPLLKAAIFLSSGSLFDATMKWLASTPTPPDEPPAALNRYLMRARTRATPFGLFGLISCGRLDEVTRFAAVMKPGDVRLVHRISYEAEAALRTQSVTQRPVRTFVRNPTLWRRGEEYLAWTSLPDALVSVDVDEELNALFDRREGPIEVSQEASQDIDSLVAAGLCIERDFLPSVLEVGASVRADAPALGETGPGGRVMDAVKALDDLPIDEAGRHDRYVEAERRVRALLGDAAPHRPVLVASVFSHGGDGADEPTLARSQAADVARIAARLVSHFGEPNRSLQALRRAFSEQLTYESVPLLECLHGELGRQFDPLVAPATLPPTRDYAGYDRYVLNEVLKAVRQQRSEVRLDWGAISTRLPARMLPGDRLVSPIFSLVSTGDAPGEGPHLAWGGMEVLTGTALLARFEGEDLTLHRHVSHWLHAQADLQDTDEVVSAEIVHVPHLSLGDVLRRVCRTRHAIYLTPCAGANGPQPIELDTLHLCLRQDRLALWCASLRKWVRPVLSVPHYHQGSMHPVYRLLCALATQELETAQLRIPEAVRGLDQCPRIVVDGTVFRPQSWTLVMPGGATVHRRAASLRALLRDRGVPRCFVWSHFDRSLRIDADLDAEFGAFLAAVGDVSELHLTEVLAPHGGQVDHEIVLPIRLRGSAPSPAAPNPVVPVAGRPPCFPPGSEYVYVQLFADRARIDRLPQRIHERIGAALSRARLTPFYTKYSVPSPHLRYRVRARDARAAWRLLQRLCRCAENLRANGHIDRLTVASYEPEVERYGGPTVWPLSDRCFAADSTFARALAAFVDHQDLGTDAIQFAMAMSCLYLASDFGWPIDGLAPLIGSDREASGAGRSAADQAAGLLLRRVKGWVGDLLQPCKRSGFVNRLVRAAAERTQATHDARAELMRAVGDDTAWRAWLYRSHAHMAMNRLAQADMEDAEPIAYALALRLAAALAARGVGRLP